MKQSVFKLYTERMKGYEKARNESKEGVDKEQTEYLLSIFKVLRNYREDMNQLSQKHLLDQYYIATKKSGYVDSQTLKKSLSLNEEVCKECNEYFTSVEGYNTCTNCGTCIKAMHYAETLSYKEMQETEHKSVFSYEKETYLEDWLSRFESRENKVIPKEILDILKHELKKERIIEFSNVSEEKIKKILRKLKLNEYYDNVITIINRLSGRPAFVLTAEIKEKLKTMFSQIQYPFELYKPVTRKNFLSYSYFLNKFFLILKLPEFAKYFPLLRSDDKLRAQDDIFIKIVKYMQKRDTTIEWKFYPSF